jgi:outer membrane protein TolC
MVGPDYAGAPDAAPHAMQASVLHRAAVAAVNAAPPLAAWWVALGDAELNKIEKLALQASPNVAEAREGGRIVSVAAMIAVAANTDGKREIVGLQQDRL